MKFILSRTEDYRHHSAKWIICHAILFWIITRIIAAACVVGCTAIYKTLGIDPESLTSFGGNPAQAVKFGPLIHTLSVILIIAPVLEESIFRLGLSFKKWQIATSVALIPVCIIWQNHLSFTSVQYAVCICISVTSFLGIYFGTRQRLWTKIKDNHLVSVSWITALSFGLIHLIEFNTVSWILLPYCISIILVPFFAGCTCTYLRINLGFRWSVAMHIFNNLPAAIIMLSI